jgi:hypothetical protein
MSEEAQGYYQRIRNSFGFSLTLIGLVADIIGIWGAFKVANQPILNADNGFDIVVSNQRVFGIFELSDVVTITLFLTLFIVVSILYFSFHKSLLQGNWWIFIVGLFGSMALSGLFLRLWLGTGWWKWVLGIFLLGILAGGVVWDVLKNGNDSAFAKWSRGDFSEK